MRRRSFLRASAGAITAVALPPNTAAASAGDTLEVTIRSGPARAGTIRARRNENFGGLLAYNGSIPGPLLRVTHGQRIVVNYSSGADVPTSIHWHGMVLPNDMDGVAGVTQAPVGFGETFRYDFAPGPPGTRWYHDHGFGFAFARGLFGAFIVDDPTDERVDREFVLVFHEVPRRGALEAARRGTSSAPMAEPAGSPEMGRMTSAAMGDEVAYAAYCINGGAYPYGERFAASTGDRVRLRLINASPTSTRYVALAGHEMRVTHADGNPLEQPVTVDVVRIGSGERYDALVEIARPGAFLLQSVASDPLQAAQAATIYTDGMEKAPPMRAPATLDNLRVLSYQLAGGAIEGSTANVAAPRYEFVLAGGGFGNGRWSIDGKLWPQTPKLRVRRDELVTLRFRNTSQMDHPMHLHGHTFSLTEIDGVRLARPLAKDVVLVPAGGTATLAFTGGSPPGRWLLHCHNEVHMVDGMMMEVVYTAK
ncbi:MAG TPA: multicopper oxidase family protein [Candidatus Cybelea sp.]|nr:multicopper oxidase family protein [Candidatus Cybelea sp.]